MTQWSGSGTTTWESSNDGDNPLVSPLRVPNAAGLLPPRSLRPVSILRDEGEAYAVRLRDAGVPVTVERYEGMIHGFYALSHALDEGKRAHQQSVEALQAAFA
ncbi:MAG: alpha/beta hydrolase fold domain-containing protein [Dehalococcoidia bacterium]